MRGFFAAFQECWTEHYLAKKVTYFSLDIANRKVRHGLLSKITVGTGSSERLWEGRCGQEGISQVPLSSAAMLTKGTK